MVETDRPVPKCRFCATPVKREFIDLGFAPPSNAYLSAKELTAPESWYPLRVIVCDACWLFQTEDYSRPQELFSEDYAYFSSVSKSWLRHCREFCEEISAKLKLGRDSFVLEIGSNDGYLLANFVEAGVPCLGVEPTLAAARASEQLGVPVCHEFFGPALAKKLATEGYFADLIIANNVFAHVPDINGFAEGMKTLLKQGGTVSIEFPHLLNLVQKAQFDTVYHEHYSYLSLAAVERILRARGLKVLDVEEIETHGGSLRVFSSHLDDPRQQSRNVSRILALEEAQGLFDPDVFRKVQERAEITKYNLIEFLIQEKRAGKRTVAYGAAAKGNTLLNFAGIKSDLVEVCYDGARSKQGKFLPGSHIPILPPPEGMSIDADNILILPWNLSSEIVPMLRGSVGFRSNLYTAVPDLMRI